MTQDSPNLPVSRINLDVSPSKLQPGEYTFMLNGVGETHDGGRMSVHNEPGNDECFKVPSTHTIIGNISLGRNRNMIFSTDDDTSHSIGIVTDCKYVPLIEESCLNFSSSHLISGEFKIRRGCNDVVYWQDDYNPDRSLDITKYLAEDCVDFDCNSILLNPKVDKPCIDLEDVRNYGGSIRAGVHFFQVELLDSSTNSIYKSEYSQAVPIYKDNTNQSFPLINGNYNIDQYLSEIGGATNSNKSLVLSIDNLDERFTYYRINILSFTNGDGLVRSAHTTELFTITSANAKYVYTGYNPSKGHYLVDVDETLIPNARYDTSVAMEQVQNRLVRIGVKESIKDYSQFQTFASKIGSSFVTREYDSTKIELGNPKDVNTYWRSMGYMPDEVDAMGIVYIHEDNSESPVFHIPGRCADLNPLNGEPLTCFGTVQNCLFVGGFGSPSGANSSGTIWQIVYQLDGGQPIFESGEFFESTTVTLYCGEAEINVISFTYTPASGGGNAVNEITSEFSENCTEDFGNFAIPPSTNWDTDIVPADHVENYLNEDAPRWKIYNTAFKLYPGAGILAYYEIENVYTKPSSCCIDNYWGVDLCGNLLEGTPIRHHKFPDRTLLCSDNGMKTQVGIKFHNIEYPPGVIGHYFVKGRKDSNDRTVLTTGVLGNMREGEDKDGNEVIGFAYFSSDPNTDKTYFMSPETLYNGDTAEGCYLKIDMEKTRNGAIETHEEIDGAGNAIKEVDTGIIARELNYTNSSCLLPTIRNVNIERSILLPPLSEQNYEGKTLVNFSQTNRVNFLDLDRVLELKANRNVYIASVKSCAEVFTNLDSIIYERMHRCSLDLNSSQEIYGGDSFHTPLNIANTLAYKFSDGIADNIFKALTVIVATALTIATAGSATIVAAALLAGAIGVTASAVVGMIENLKDSKFESFLSVQQIDDAIQDMEGGTDFSDYLAYASEYMSGLFVDSTINTSLRNTGTTECNEVYQGEQTILGYFKNKILYYETDTGSFAPKPILCPEFYEYNKDYSITSSETVYFPVSKVFDYCSRCIGEYSSRVIWSPVSFDEDLGDTYRTNKVLDYKDFPANRGVLTDIKYKFQSLFLHATQSTFVIRPNPQTIQLDGTEAYLGTGTFLGVPEQELSQSDIGYAGKQNKFNSVITPNGYTWVDQVDGKVFNFNGSALEEISKAGVYHWFQENLPSVIESKNSTDFPITTDAWLTATYNPVTECYIIHKKDYYTDYAIGVREDFKTIAWDGTNFVYNGAIIELDNTDFFCDISWTFSYSYKDKGWKSWHSYMPDWQYYTEDNFFTTKGNLVYAHNSLNHQKFYDKKYDYIIEYPINSTPTTTDKHSIQWYGDVKELDFNTQAWKHHSNITFDKLWLYNNTQSTGLQTLVLNDNPFNNIGWSNEIKHVKHTADNYKVSQLRDITTDSPTYTTKCVQTDYGSYIDKLPINIDYNLPLYKLSDIKDKHVLNRLYFSKDNNPRHRITTHLFNNKIHPTKR